MIIFLITTDNKKSRDIAQLGTLHFRALTLSDALLLPERRIALLRGDLRATKRKLFRFHLRLDRGLFVLPPLDIFFGAELLYFQFQLNLIRDRAYNIQKVHNLRIL